MKTDKQAKPYLIFSLADEKYAVHVDHVQEVVEPDLITKVPNVPAYMLGIINLRGRVLPLLDTRLKLGLPQSEITKRSRILILNLKRDENKYIEIGALVDVAQEVVEINPANVQETPDVDTRKDSAPITGILNDNGNITMIMDIDRVFSIQEILQINNN
jgi:purine-binding chemotaxis protein CheW